MLHEQVYALITWILMATAVAVAISFAQRPGEVWSIVSGLYFVVAAILWNALPTEWDQQSQ